MLLDPYNQDEIDDIPGSHQCCGGATSLLESWLTAMKSPDNRTFRKCLRKFCQRSRGFHISRRVDEGLTIADEEDDDVDVTTYTDGSELVGKKNLQGLKEGRCRFYSNRLGRYYEGKCIKGCWQGWVTSWSDNESNNEFIEEFYNAGMASGSSRKISYGDKSMLEVRHDSDKLRYHLKETEGGGIMISMDTGAGSDKDMRVFVHPGYEVAIVGDFTDDGNIIKGQEYLVSSIQWTSQGFPYPLMMPSRHLTTEVSYEKPSGYTIASVAPLRRDLVDHLNSYVAQSEIPDAGEGLFAKRDIRAGSVVSYFSGVRKRRLFRSLPCQANCEEWSDYAITLNKSISLDIPSACTNVFRYCATSGHKACHSFEPNCKFARRFHPRFGFIMAVVAVKDIERHEEVTVHYRYPIATAPTWYRNLWYRYLKVNLGWAMENVVQYGNEAHEVQARFHVLNRRFSKKDLKE